jgi:hypothetical protein
MKITFELNVEVEKRSLQAFWDKLGIVVDEVCNDYCNGRYELKEIKREE